MSKWACVHNPSNHAETNSDKYITQQANYVSHLTS